jgi:DNA-binding response OmpR family regulator
VLLDVMMPGLDGWGVLERLQEPKPAVIVVSGLATDRDHHYRHAVELGALGFVSKPFDSTKLLELVETASRLDADQRIKFREWLLDGSPEPGQ